jgi:hypothetical protein
MKFCLKKTARSFQTHAMYLLAVFESRLGSIDTWPSYILRFLFIDQPNSATVRRVAGFFCGNGIECSLAAEFYGLCSQYAGIAVKAQIYRLYQHWQNSPWTHHKIEYYNVRLQRHIYLNGECCRLQEESVVSVPAPLALGPEGTAFDKQIRHKPEHIHHVVRGSLTRLCPSLQY